MKSGHPFGGHGRGGRGQSIGRGQGHGMGMGRNPGFAERHQHDQDVFHRMLELHDQITRKVEKLTNGIRTLTTSNNPDIVKLLHDHVPSMHERLMQGMTLRNWDPLYVEIFTHRDEIEMHIELLDDGVAVFETSESPYVVSLIQAHADAVDAFVEKGFEAAEKTSPMPAGKP